MNISIVIKSRSQTKIALVRKLSAGDKIQRKCKLTLNTSLLNIRDFFHKVGFNLPLAYKC